MLMFWKHPELNREIVNVPQSFFPKRRTGASWVKVAGINFYVIKKYPSGKTSKLYGAYNSDTGNYVAYNKTKEGLIELLERLYPKNIEFDYMPFEFEKYITKTQKLEKKQTKKGKQ